MRLAAAGDPLLDDHRIAADQRGGALIKREQRVAVFRLPGLRPGEFVQALAVGRLENDREAAIEPLGFMQIARAKAPRVIDAQRRRALDR